MYHYLLSTAITEIKKRESINVYRQGHKYDQEDRGDVTRRFDYRYESLSRPAENIPRVKITKQHENIHFD